MRKKAKHIFYLHLSSSSTSIYSSFSFSSSSSFFFFFSTRYFNFKEDGEPFDISGRDIITTTTTTNNRGPSFHGFGIGPYCPSICSQTVYCFLTCRFYRVHKKPCKCLVVQVTLHLLHSFAKQNLLCIYDGKRCVELPFGETAHMRSL